MTPPSCAGCAFHRQKFGNDLCTRPRRMKSGRTLKGETWTLYETSEAASEERADGDHCGVERRHFQPGSVM